MHHPHPHALTPAPYALTPEQVAALRSAFVELCNGQAPEVLSPAEIAATARTHIANAEARGARRR